MSAEAIDADRLDQVRRGWSELASGRPLAAWAAWRGALATDPDHKAARAALDLLENAEDLPLAARSPRRFRPPGIPRRRDAWNRALEGRDLARLETAERVFADLAVRDPEDSDARYNQSLCLAWLGRNLDALAMLERAVALDADDRFELAVDAWLLAEVLRFGQGAETLADDLDCARVVPWDEALDGDPLELDAPGLIRLLPNPAGSIGDDLLPGARVYERLDRPMPEPTDDLRAEDLPRVVSTLILSDGRLRASRPGGPETRPPLIRDDLDGDSIFTPLPARLLDAGVWIIRLPSGLDRETRSRLTREHVESYYENDWIHLPRHALSGDGRDSRSPLEASRAARSGDPIARAKLSAVILFREQLGSRPGTLELYAGYPFDRLRRRLGLDPRDPALIDPSDVSSMTADELSSLDPDSLDLSVLADARLSALGLRENALADRFEKAIADRENR